MSVLRVRQFERLSGVLMRDRQKAAFARAAPFVAQIGAIAFTRRPGDGTSYLHPVDCRGDGLRGAERHCVAGACRVSRNGRANLTLCIPRTATTAKPRHRLLAPTLVHRLQQTPHEASGDAAELAERFRKPSECAGAVRI